MKQIQPFQKHWLQITSIVVCRLNRVHISWDVLRNLNMCDEWVSAAKRNFSRESVLNITPQTAISTAIPVKHLEMSVQYDPMGSF